MVDVSEILALAPAADPGAATTLARSLTGRQRLLAAAMCQGEHLHALTTKELWVSDSRFAHVQASKRDMQGAVVTPSGPDEVRLAVLGAGGLQPPHRFGAIEGVELARAINQLVGQPPEGPPVTALGRGRVAQRPTAWQSPSLTRAGDSCDVTVVPDGVQLYFSSGDYPMSTVFAPEKVAGVLGGTKPVILLESHGELLEVELDADIERVIASIPGATRLQERPLPRQSAQRPLSSLARETPSPPLDAERPRRLIRSSTKGDCGARVPSQEPFTTRDGTVITRLVVPANEADMKWEELAADVAASRRWPLIIGDRSLFGEDELARFVEDASSDRAAPASELLAAAASLDVGAVLGGAWDDTLPIAEEEEDPEALDSFDESPPDGAVRPIPRRLVPAGHATIALIPASSPEEVMAVLAWGSWNACPSPEEHVCVLRHWRTRYGAVVKSISTDTLELAVSAPPETFADALLLAREQYAYAPDIVDQGEHPTIGTLAAALVGSAHWHFWWD